MYTVCSTTSSLSLSPPTCCNPPERTIWYIPVQTPLPLPSPGGTFPTESHNPRPILFKKCRQEHKTTQRAKEEQNANEHRTIRNVRGSSLIFQYGKKEPFSTRCTFWSVGEIPAPQPRPPQPSVRPSNQQKTRQMLHFINDRVTAARHVVGQIGHTFFPPPFWPSFRLFFLVVSFDK